MNKINDGGPAFPNVPEGAGSRWADWDMGMTLRDYFAAKAMSGYLANPWQAEQLDETGDSSREQMALVAEISYVMADAMLAARGAK